MSPNPPFHRWGYEDGTGMDFGDVVRWLKANQESQDKDDDNEEGEAGAADERGPRRGRRVMMRRDLFEELNDPDSNVTVIVVGDPNEWERLVQEHRDRTTGRGIRRLIRRMTRRRRR